MTMPQHPAPGGCPQRIALINGSFEEPVIPTTDVDFQDQNDVPGWFTTATDGQIEFWPHGYRGVPAGDGRQFAELNANQFSTLYQDLPTTPGTRLYWRLLHRGRNGEDTMRVQIGPPPVGGQEFAPNHESGDLTDGTDAWGEHTGVYTVPAGQSTTRFAFKSVSAAGGDATVGNFLDGIFFGTAPCVVVSKTVAPETGAGVGDTLTYRVNLKNEGGVPAENVILRDVIPAGTGYVDGSLRIIGGPGSDDRTSGRNGRYDPGTRRLTVPLGEGAGDGHGGVLGPTTELPDGITVEFRVRVERDGAGRALVNQAEVTYDNTYGDDVEHLTSTSNTSTHHTARAVDLGLVKAADQVHATVGEAVTYHLAVTNHGPTQATGVQVTDRLPASLRFLSATPSAGAYDPATGLWNVGTLPVGETAHLILRAKVTQAGTFHNTATAHANETRTDVPVSAISTICVHEQPDCITTPDTGSGTGGGGGTVTFGGVTYMIVPGPNGPVLIPVQPGTGGGGAGGGGTVTFGGVTYMIVPGPNGPILIPVQPGTGGIPVQPGTGGGWTGGGIVIGGVRYVIVCGPNGPYLVQVGSGGGGGGHRYCVCE
ncbi:DUF11 domain-containing protein [Nonomuraea sp. NPDC050404]|uniref:DUF11 domain-containing protein n=1 Tax=Nonomuraea sp. NPDC050404 TaxID=3155783 RepID=UPI0033DAA169